MQTFIEYLTAVYHEHDRNYGWRVGQAYFNVLHQRLPTLANLLRGRAVLDPFYNDGNIPAFLAYVAENWERYQTDLRRVEP